MARSPSFRLLQFDGTGEPEKWERDRLSKWYAARLSKSARQVYLALRLEASQGERGLAVTAFAKTVGMAHETVRRAVKQLAETGFLALSADGPAKVSLISVQHVPPVDKSAYRSFRGINGLSLNFSTESLHESLGFGRIVVAAVEGPMHWPLPQIAYPPVPDKLAAWRREYAANSQERKGDPSVPQVYPDDEIRRLEKEERMTRVPQARLVEEDSIRLRLKPHADSRILASTVELYKRLLHRAVRRKSKWFHHSSTSMSELQSILEMGSPQRLLRSFEALEAARLVQRFPQYRGIGVFPCHSRIPDDTHWWLLQESAKSLIWDWQDEHERINRSRLTWRTHWNVVNEGAVDRPVRFANVPWTFLNLWVNGWLGWRDGEDLEDFVGGLARMLRLGIQQEWPEFSGLDMSFEKLLEWSPTIEMVYFRRTVEPTIQSEDDEAFERELGHRLRPTGKRFCGADCDGCYRPWPPIRRRRLEVAWSRRHRKKVLVELYEDETVDEVNVDTRPWRGFLTTEYTTPVEELPHGEPQMGLFGAEERGGQRLDYRCNRLWRFGTRFDIEKTVLHSFDSWGIPPWLR